jgi:chromate reductase, NAD(P)H dehydrogenase (quinone)
MIMELSYPVAVLVGSLRTNSLSGSIARALMARAPQSLHMFIVPIDSLPLYNSDTDDNPPQAYVDFRRAIASASGVLIVTPEYNRGVPGALKNAVDVGSRPYGQNAFDGKPAAIISQSPGSIGGALANHALRPTLMFLNMPTLAQPEMYLSHSTDLLDSDGQPVSDRVANLFDGFLNGFEHWIDMHARTPTLASAAG